MSNNGTNNNQPSRAEPSRRSLLSTKKTVEERLKRVGVRVDRSVSIVNGTKIPLQDNHTEPSNQTRPSDIDGNYSIHGGDGLVIIDIDNPANLPRWVNSLPVTFSVKTVHEGLHHYYQVEDDTGVSNTELDWGEIRYDGQLVVGPGSIVDHDTFSRCKNCSKTGQTAYRIRNDVPITTLTAEHLASLREVCSSGGRVERDATGGETNGQILTYPDEGIADEAERYLCEEFAPRYATALASSDLMDLLRGGTGSYDLCRDTDSSNIDRSAADYYALEMLYGAFRFRGEDPDVARRFTLALFKRYCLENRHDKTGNRRKWLTRGDKYLCEQMDAVEEQFDLGHWHRWRRRKYDEGFDAEVHRPWTDPSKDGKPSLITKDTVHASMWILTEGVSPETAARVYGLDFITHTNCGEMCTPPSGVSGSTSRFERDRYPTASEVGELAAELNPDRKASYFEETLKYLHRETDEFARAVCNGRENGKRHVYFFSDMRPPVDADKVYHNGKEYDPETYREKD